MINLNFRSFSYQHFWVPIGVITILGMLFSEEAKDPLMMNRQQTEEWKGI